MGDLLNLAASPKVLNLAWKHHCKDKTVWSETLSKKEMERNMIFHILQLADDLKQGVYAPAAVRMFPMKKGNGGQRIISALTLRDKIAQRAVLLSIENLAENSFHHDSFGYRPGRTVDMAIAKAREYILCGNTWLVDADIEKFFDTIPHRSLLKSLKQMINDRELIRLIEQWIKVGTPRTGFLGKRKGIPQGAVLSPLFCNLYLTAFDNHLARHNLPFVRYADDFLIFLPDQKQAAAALDCARKGLKTLKLQLNRKKTRVAQAGPRVVFLGRNLPKQKRFIT